MGTQAPQAVERIASEIQRYCAVHPDACDNLEGIAWWLARQRYDDTLADVRAAVDSLVADGLLIAHRLGDGTTVFGCVGGANQKPIT